MLDSAMCSVWLRESAGGGPAPAWLMRLPTLKLDTLVASAYTSAVTTLTLYMGVRLASSHYR